MINNVYAKLEIMSEQLAFELHLRTFIIRMANELFEQPADEDNAAFEKIINDLMEQHYSVVPNLFSPAEVQDLRQELLSEYKQDAFQKAAIGNRFNEQIKSEIRGDFILWLNRESEKPASKAFLQRIDALTQYLNRTCFLGIVQSEFHYALYPSGSFYKRHLDAFQNDDRRKLSIILYLNESDWQAANGGELVIYTNQNNTEAAVKVNPFPGVMVIFESKILEHEVFPANRNRLSITGWLKTR
jgi:SM-20-related protein